MASGAGQRVVPSSQAPVQPLGPNTNIVNRGPDSALLRPSIKTSVTGVRQIIKALESSHEIRDYLLNEVNVVYECKVCMNMFRSLANLTAHKRSYCLEKYEEVNHVFSSKAGAEAASLRTVIVEGELVETVIPEDNTENLSPSLDLLKDAGLISELEGRSPNNRLLPPKKSLTSVVERLAARKSAEHRNDVRNKIDTETNSSSTDMVLMEPIDQTVKAQFQSYSTGFKYKEIQSLNNPVSVTVGKDGKEIKDEKDGDSDESKENMEEEFDPNAPVDDNGNQVKYPCPECKKGFSKLGNVYKHLSNLHGKTKNDYSNLRKIIADGAYVVDKENGLEKPATKTALQNLAMAIGLVNKAGVGMQKVNKVEAGRQEKRPEDNTLAELQAPRRGRPPKTRNPDIPSVKSVSGKDDDSDGEVSFNPTSLSPEGGGAAKGKKRKRTESSRTPITNAWRGGQFQCVLCDRSFGTPTFLMQHYVSPHFSRELRNEFGHCLVKKKCPTCHAKFDTETKLMMHIGCTHREVHKYLPDQAKDLMPGVRTAGSPVKVVKTPIRCPAPPTNDLFQKFTEANPPSKSGGKKSPPKAADSLVPDITDEFMS